MTEDLPTLRARLDRLRRQRASGVARVTAEGRTVEYRADEEINRVIADLEREVAARERRLMRVVYTPGAKHL